MMDARTQDPKELQAVGGDAPIDWLAEYAGSEDKSLDSMAEYRVLPRIKQVQGTTGDELKDAHGEGAAIIIPGPVELCKKDGSFTFVPVFMWTEFWQMSSLKDQNSGMIMEKTQDKTGDISKSARNADHRTFYYRPSGDAIEFVDRPEGNWKDGENGIYTGRFVEVLIFAVVITSPDHPLSGTGATMSFMKGEFGTGKNFCNAVGMRKISTPDGPKQAPLWSTQWEARPARRTRGADQKWWGFDIVNAAAPYIQPQDAPFYKGMYEEISELHAKNAVGMDTSDMDDEATTEEAATSTKF